MPRIILSLALIVMVTGAIAFGATNAFFSDTETSTGNVFTAGAIDLKVDNESYYNGVANAGTSWEPSDLNDDNGPSNGLYKFFDFSDLKPDDYGEDTISLHVDTNDAYMCADVTLTSDDDNGINEPESLIDNTDGAGNGELGGLVNFIWWADDGDNVLESDENVISQGPIGALPLNTPYELVLADADENVWGGSGPVDGDTTYYLGKAWCFGTIGEAPITQDNLTDAMSPAGNNAGTGLSGEPEDGGITCDGSALGNESQTDTLTADISFDVVQSRNNDGFQCTETELRRECVTGEEFADTTGLFDQGKTKLGAVIAANRSNPVSVTGAPQTTGLPSDPAPIAGSFISLGFGVNTAATRSIVLNFADNRVVNEPGADLRVYEVTGGVYPDEFINVEASKDGITWTTIASNVARDEDIDLGALDWAAYIRVTDVSNPANFSDSVADGYDLDAIEALHCDAPLQV